MCDPLIHAATLDKDFTDPQDEYVTGRSENPNTSAEATARGNRASKPGFFKRILVALDESEQASAALDVAAGIARQFGADLVLLNVFSVNRGLAHGMGLIEPEFCRECLEAGEKLLNRAKRRLSKSIQLETILRAGDPSAEILTASILYDIDLIVMGTHGRGRIAQIMLGSVASAVTRGAACPVLTVPDGDENAAFVESNAVESQESAILN